MRRRSLLTIPLATLGAASLIASRGGQGGVGSERILLVGPSTSPVYQDAFSGLLERLRSGRVETVVIDPRGDTGLSELDKAIAGKPKLAVAIGSEAVELAAKGKWPFPVVTSMTLRPPEGSASIVSSIVLGVPLSVVLMKLKSCFPGKSRIGVIFGPASSEDRVALKVDCARAGFSAEFMDCSAPADLVPRILALKGRKVDFVLCLPDSTLYNAATIKPLVMVSLEQRIPLVAFSASFVRAGAVVGVYADLKELGRQTGDAALRYLASRSPNQAEGPRAVQVGINQRVARLIGLELPDKESAEVVVFR